MLNRVKRNMISCLLHLINYRNFAIKNFQKINLDKFKKVKPNIELATKAINYYGLKIFKNNVVFVNKKRHVDMHVSNVKYGIVSNVVNR